ncbi:MAG: chemotaxis protein CheW [Pseudomonadales bacterium]|nr:chemotaxis protein CheW [Pseudomonadales bacterium]
MPKERDDSSLLSASDRAIYQYLDEMLCDPDEGSGQRSFEDSPNEASLDTELPDEGESKPESLSASTPASRVNSLPEQFVDSTLPKPEAALQRAEEPQSKPFKIKEKNQPAILTSTETLIPEQEPETLPRETMLGFEKPIVVQQPAPAKEIQQTPIEAKEQQLEAEATKTATTEEPVVETKTETPADTPVAEVPIVATPTQEPIQEKEAEAKPQVAIKPTIKTFDSATIKQSRSKVEPDIDPSTVMGIVADKEGRLPPMTPWEEPEKEIRPEWAEGRFECLLFKVAGLKLAVPLVTLGMIHEIDRRFNLLPGQLDWFIGILQTQGGNIKVMDTALCVMPEKYTPASREGLNYVITLHGFEWGIACHEILHSITLEPEDVKWRSKRGKRPWLAGTVVDQMCALVDTEGFHHVIKQAEKRD